MSRKKTPELPTGLKPLDDVIWGLHRKQVTVISGRPGEAKTSLAVNIAFHLANIGKKVLYCSLEMSAEEIIERILCNVCQIDGEILRRGDLPEDFEAKEKTFGVLLDMINMKIIDSRGYDHKELLEIVSAFKKSDRPDIVFVDHIQKISSIGFANKQDAISEYALTAERIARKENLSMVIVSQLNRESVKGKGMRPSIDQLKGSGTLEEGAATVLMNWWKTKDAEKDPSERDFRVIVGKQRHGHSDIEVPLQFNASQNRFFWSTENSWKELKEWKQSDNPSKPFGVEASFGTSNHSA